MWVKYFSLPLPVFWNEELGESMVQDKLGSYVFFFVVVVLFFLFVFWHAKAAYSQLAVQVNLRQWWNWDEVSQSGILWDVPFWMQVLVTHVPHESVYVITKCNTSLKQTQARAGWRSSSELSCHCHEPECYRNPEHQGYYCNLHK